MIIYIMSFEYKYYPENICVTSDGVPVGILTERECLKRVSEASLWKIRLIPPLLEQ